MMQQQVVVKVGMADMNVASNAEVLRTTGLGSCVGVVVYDTKVKVAGMAHVMLPSSGIVRDGNVNIAKYADTAIPELVNRLSRLGASQTRMVAKLAGGAQMFAFQSTQDTMRIGPRNVEACKAQLEGLSIPVLAEETGGSFGRTIEFHAATGIMVLRTVQQGVKEI